MGGGGWNPSRPRFSREVAQGGRWLPCGCKGPSMSWARSQVLVGCQGTVVSLSRGVLHGALTSPRGTQSALPRGRAVRNSQTRRVEWSPHPRWGQRPSQDTRGWHGALGLPESRAEGTSVCCFSHLAYGILLQQPEQTSRGVNVTAFSKRDCCVHWGKTALCLVQTFLPVLHSGKPQAAGTARERPPLGRALWLWQAHMSVTQCFL